MISEKFQDSFTQHKKYTPKNKSKRNATSFSTYTWDTEIDTQTEIEFDIFKKWSLFKPSNSYCDICISEKRPCHNRLRGENKLTME